LVAGLFLKPSYRALINVPLFIFPFNTGPKIGLSVFATPGLAASKSLKGQAPALLKSTWNQIPMRTDGRKPDEMRPLTFRRRYTRQAPGSVLVRQGRTLLLCTCTVEPAVPPFLVGSGKGWLTAEYGMLPGSTGTRKPRDRGGKIDGRSVEIQRLIGRSLRAIVSLENLGERTLWIDCDVLEADGGTRTASINGAFVALVDALVAAKPSQRGAAPLPPLKSIIRDSVAAVSVGLLNDTELLDLNYAEDKDAEVDMNLVMTGGGQFVEVQASAEGRPYTNDELQQLIDLAADGIRQITKAQQELLHMNFRGRPR
jgi:ribonuclease PH